MMNLPMSPIESEALACARQLVAEFREGFESEAGARLARRMLKLYALQHPDNMAMLKADARAGWAEADEALRELIREVLGRGLQLPPQLADYNIDALHPVLGKRPSGPKKSSNVLRNIIFVRIVGELCVRFNLKPTRRGARRHSASSILALALKEELPGRFAKAKAAERAVTLVWSNFAPVAFRWAGMSVFWPAISKA